MKKFFSAFLLMTAMVLSVSTFVACNDLVDEVEDVKAQTTQNAADIAAINAQLTVLQQGIAEAKQAAADAKTFAQQCAAEAKAEALAAIAEYAASNDAEIATIKGMIQGVAADLDVLEGTVNEQAKAIAALDQQIATLKKYAEDKVAEIVKELETIKGNIKANSDNIATLQSDLADVLEKIAAIDAELVTLENLIYNVLKSVAYIPHTIDDQLNELEDGFSTFFRCTAAAEALEQVTSNCVTFTYRVNPANAEIAVEELSFLAIGVETKAEQSDVFEVVSMTRQGDRLSVKVKSKMDLPTGGIVNNKAMLVALKVSNENYTIVSDYTAVADVDHYGYKIRNAKNTNHAEFFNVCWHDAATAPYNNNVNFYPEAYVAEIPVQLVYSGKVDIADYVETFCTSTGEVLDNAFECVDVTYEYALVEKYISPVDKVTDQQQFVVLNGSELEVKPNKEIADAEAAKIVAVGKTPVVQVTALVNGKAVAKAYVKVDIVEEPFVAPEKKDPITILVNNGAVKTYKYSELHDKDATPAFAWTKNTSDFMTWTDLTVNVLAHLDVYLSNEKFVEIYDVEAATAVGAYVTADGINHKTDADGNVLGMAFSTDPELVPATTTTWAGYALNSLVYENCTGEVTITIPVKKDANLGYNSNEYYYPEAINLVFKFAVEHETVLPVLNDLYSAENLVVVKGHATPGAPKFEWSYEEYLHEAFKLSTYNNVCNPHHTPLAFKLAAGEKRAVLINDYVATENTDVDAWQNVIITLDVDGANDTFEKNILTDFTAGYATAGTLRTIDDLVWDATGIHDVPVTLYTVLDNGNECSMTYTVRFVNPFAVTLGNAVLATDLDGEKYNTLKDTQITFDGKAVYENGAYTALADELKLTLSSEYSIIGSTVHEEVAKGVNENPFYGYSNWLHWTDKGMIYWNNGGTQLNQDVVCQATVFAFCNQIGWFTIAQPATVTLQKTK